MALPGSKKAVSECLQVLLGTQSTEGVLLHGLELCTGSGLGEEVHRRLQGGEGRHIEVFHRTSHHGTETDIGESETHTIHHGPGHHHGPEHHHHHGHGYHAQSHGIHSHKISMPRTTPQQRDEAARRYLSHDAAANTALIDRARESPYPILSLTEALTLIAREAPPPLLDSDVVEASVDPHLVGHVLAKNVTAQRNLPPMPTTNVDGYAVMSALTPIGEYTVLTASELTALGRSFLAGKEVIRINTGQGLPPGADAVVMVEDTQLISDRQAKGGSEEARIRILAQVNAGENVRPEGSDIRNGDVVLRAGTVISPLGGEVGTLAFLGYGKVAAFRKPRVALLSTGEELQDVLTPVALAEKTKGDWTHSSFDTNRPSLLTALSSSFYPTVDLGIVGDTPVERLLERIKEGLRDSDVLITTGGTSMGESDVLKPLIERSLGPGAKIHFGRVSIKPGKPTTFATVDGYVDTTGTKAAKRKVIFALPGNPASALVCFYVFVLPALRKMSGLNSTSWTEGVDGKKEAAWSLPYLNVTLGHSMALDVSRPEFHRVRIEVDTQGCAGQTTSLIATSTGKQRSSGMHSMSVANGFVLLPSARDLKDSKKTLAEGETVRGLLLGWL